VRALFFNGSGSSIEDPRLFPADSDIAPAPLARGIRVERLSN